MPTAACTSPELARALGVADAHLRSLPASFNINFQTGHIVSSLTAAQSHLAAAMAIAAGHRLGFEGAKPVLVPLMASDTLLRSLPAQFNIHTDMGLIVGNLVASARSLADALQLLSPGHPAVRLTRETLDQVPTTFRIYFDMGQVVGGLHLATRLLLDSVERL